MIRSSYCPHRHIVFSLWLVVSLVTVGCKKDEGVAPKVEPKVAETQKPAEPPKPQSPLPAAQDVLTKLEPNDATFNAIKSVRDYAKANPKAQDATAAASAVMIAEVRIAVRSVLEKNPDSAATAAKALELPAGETDGFAGLLKDTQDLSSEFGGADGAQFAGQIAAAIVAIEAGSKNVEPAILLQTALKEEPLSLATRGYLLHKLKAPILKLQRARQDQISSEIDPFAASLLCPTCPEILVNAKGDVTAALSRGDAGLVCDAAKALIGGKTGMDALKVLEERCDAGFFGLAEKETIVNLAASNYLPVRLVTTISALLNAPKVDADPLGEQAASAANDLLGEVGTLRLPLWVPVFPAMGTTPGVPMIPMMGPPMVSAPLEVLSVDSTDVRLASRPVIELMDRAVSFADRKAGLSFPGNPTITVEQLLTPPTAPVEGQEVSPLPTDVLSAAITKHREAVAGIEAAIGADDADALMAGYNTKRDKGSWGLLVAAETKTSVKVLAKVAQSAVTAGYGSVRFLSGPVPSANVPTMLQTAASAGGVADQRFDRPVLVAIRDGGVDVFPPDGKRADAKTEVEGAVPAAWPPGSQPWYLYETLFKVTVPATPDTPHIESSMVAMAARKMAGDNGGGNVFFVEAADDVPTGRLVAILDALNRASGPAMDAAVAYPGLVCDAGTDSVCPTHITVLFTGVAIPNSGKLTPEPQKKPDKVVVEAPPPKEEPSPEFCNDGDIKRVMGGRAGAFKFCYERELQLEPELQGRVVLRFNIPESGKPTAIGIASSTIKKQSLNDCLIKNVEKLTFESPKGGVCAVRWPLTFNPN